MSRLCAREHADEWDIWNRGNSVMAAPTDSLLPCLVTRDAASSGLIGEDFGKELWRSEFKEQTFGCLELVSVDGG
jgi:hypothetical protein